MLVKRLEDICLNLLLKGCDLDYFFERPSDFRISMYRQIDCDWCLFYKDMVTFSAGFNKIHLCSKTFKMADVFYLFLG